ncbi:MAG: hypothetical protein U0X75_30295 [Acidobacteriota bacterium]
MKLQYAQSFFRFGALAVLAGALTLSACNKSSVVNDAPANTTQAGQAPAQSQPAAAASVAPAAATEQAQPNAANAAAVSASPKVTPTPLPIMKEAMAKPGVPVSVPESICQSVDARRNAESLAGDAARSPRSHSGPGRCAYDAAATCQNRNAAFVRGKQISQTGAGAFGRDGDFRQHRGRHRARLFAGSPVTHRALAGVGWFGARNHQRRHRSFASWRGSIAPTSKYDDISPFSGRR